MRQRTVGVPSDEIREVVSLERDRFDAAPCLPGVGHSQRFGFGGQSTVSVGHRHVTFNRNQRTLNGFPFVQDKQIKGGRGGENSPGLGDDGSINASPGDVHLAPRLHRETSNDGEMNRISRTDASPLHVSENGQSMRLCARQHALSAGLNRIRLERGIHARDASGSHERDAVSLSDDHRCRNQGQRTVVGDGEVAVDLVRLSVGPRAEDDVLT